MTATQDSQMTGCSDDDSQCIHEVDSDVEGQESQTTVDDEVNQAEDEEKSEDGSEENRENDPDEEEEEDRFPYTVEDIAALFTDFYQFLAKLQFNPDDLKFPPPEGWPNLAPEHVGTWKEDFALEVMRHLPYFQNGGNTQADYKQRFEDYSVWSPRQFAEPEWWEQYMDYERDGSPFHPRMAFIVAQGHESGGQQWVLDAEHGEMWVVSMRCDTQGPFDLREFFEAFKDKTRRLQILSLRGQEVIDSSEVEERAERISEAEVIAQDVEELSDFERFFGNTPLDLQYLRQIYRDQGWPDAFRRTECEDYVHNFMVRFEEQTGREPWDSDHIG
jgi:hypothetical protein